MATVTNHFFQGNNKLCKNVLQNRTNLLLRIKVLTPVSYYNTKSYYNVF